MVSFCEHYGTVILPTKPAMSRHKDKVEAGKQFGSLAAQNLHLAHWETRLQAVKHEQTQIAAEA